jgi:hypothetical protein
VSVKKPTASPEWNATGDDGAPVEVTGWSGSGTGEAGGCGAAAACGEGAGEGRACGAGAVGGDAPVVGEGDGDGCGDGDCRTFGKSNRFIPLLATPSRR